MAEPKEPLTERELEIVRLLGTGVGNKDIAVQLFLSPNTVKAHLRNIFTKLEATSRTEVTLIAIRNGWINVNQNATSGKDADSVSPVTAIDQNSPVAVLSEFDNVIDQVAPGVSSLRDAILTTVQVAPNPQVIPKIPKWRRITLGVTVILLIVLIGVAVPPATIGSSESFDPLKIGPSQSRNGLLAQGEASRWYLRAPLPAARARAVAIASGNHIYLIGGEVNQVVTPDVFIYETISNTWTILNTPKPTAVANTAAVAINDTIYLAGGTTTTGNPTDALEAYDTKSGKWRVLASLPLPLAGHTMAVFGEQLFVFGGIGDHGPSARGFRYDIVQDKWQPIASMSSPRSLMATETVNDRIYIIGGFNEGRELNTCAIYLPVSDAWSECAPMTSARSGLGLARVGTNLFVVGGGSTAFIGFNERYDTLTNRWSPLETPITSDWQSVAVASMPGEFYVFGGYSNGERLTFTYVYEVFTNRAYVPAFLSSDNSGKTP